MWPNTVRHFRHFDEALGTRTRALSLVFLARRFTSSRFNQKIKLKTLNFTRKLFEYKYSLRTLTLFYFSSLLLLVMHFHISLHHYETIHTINQNVLCSISFQVIKLFVYMIFWFLVFKTLVTTKRLSIQNDNITNENISKNQTPQCYGTIQKTIVGANFRSH